MSCFNEQISIFNRFAPVCYHDEAMAAAAFNKNQQLKIKGRPVTVLYSQVTSKQRKSKAKRKKQKELIKTKAQAADKKKPDGEINIVLFTILF